MILPSLLMTVCVCSGCEWPQAELYVVCEPDELHSRFSFLARPDGSRQVAEVVAHLEGYGDVAVLALRDHFDEETDLVRLPEGHHTREGAKKRSNGAREMNKER